MFGTLPSELLKLSPFELGVNITCLQALNESNSEMARREKATVQLVREI